MVTVTQLPHNVRRFVHKKLLRGVSGLLPFLPVPGAGIIGKIIGAIPRGGGGGGGSGCPSGCWRDSLGRCRSDRGANSPRNPIAFCAGSASAPGGRPSPFDTIVQPPPATTCRWPMTLFEGKCVRPFMGDQPGIDDTPVGEALMGRYGAAYVPGSLIVDRAVCLSGDVVGDDGLCYPKKSLTNKERQWPRGRRPLLTGGEMRAISIASRAAGRLERTQKRLQKMGMIKKIAPRRPKLIPAHTHSEH